MTDKELWDKYAAENDVRDAEYEAWAFGGDPDLLAELVKDGIKTATASAYPLYEIEGEPLPEAGEYSVIRDSGDEAVCIIRTKRVYVAPFKEVSAEHAYKEGEGDRSLEYWRKVHEEFFAECMEEAGLAFTPDMDVVCEEFEVVYK
ncbi:MAG: ASCH domain-containing protein [Lachnospiraceae bacterium]|nr:ASCH domain-containing protein [Lachnospiraceae bacterium]